MTRIRIKNTGVEFNIVGVGTETARLTYASEANCNVPVYYIQNEDIIPGYYQGNNYISKDELDHWLSNGEAEIVS